MNTCLFLGHPPNIFIFEFQTVPKEEQKKVEIGSSGWREKMIVHICIFICFTGDYFFLLLSHQSYIGIGHTTAINEKNVFHTFLWFLFYLILLLTPEMYNSTTEHCFSFSHRCAIGFKSMACNPRLAGDRIACTLYNFFQFKTKSKAKKTTTNK